jgi:hypothetical protein
MAKRKGRAANPLAKMDANKCFGQAVLQKTAASRKENKAPLGNRATPKPKETEKEISPIRDHIQKKRRWCKNREGPKTEEIAFAGQSSINMNTVNPAMYATSSMNFGPLLEETGVIRARPRSAYHHNVGLSIEENDVDQDSKFERERALLFAMNNRGDNPLLYKLRNYPHNCDALFQVSRCVRCWRIYYAFFSHNQGIFTMRPGRRFECDRDPQHQNCLVSFLKTETIGNIVLSLLYKDGWFTVGQCAATCQELFYLFGSHPVSLMLNRLFCKPANCFRRIS